MNSKIQKIEIPIHENTLSLDLGEYQKKTEKGVPNGYATLDSDGKVSLNQLPETGSFGITMEFILSELMKKGDYVSLKDDGKIEKYEMKVYQDKYLFGNVSYISLQFDPFNSNRFLVGYYDDDNSGYGTVILGTINGDSSITFGNEYVFNSGYTDFISLQFDPFNSNRFLVGYNDYENSGYGTVRLGTISGSSITFGNKIVFNSGNTYSISLQFVPFNSNRFLVGYRDDDNSGYGTVILGTISGSSITFDNKIVFNSSYTDFISLQFDPFNSNRFIIGYRDDGNSGYGTVILGTISGSSITFGNEYVFNSYYTYNISLQFDPFNSNRFLVGYSNNDGESGYGTVRLGTISGSSITFGNEYVFNGGYIYNITLQFDPFNSNRFIIGYRDDDNSGYGTVILGTISGSSITFGNEIVFNSYYTDYISLQFDPLYPNSFLVGYYNYGYDFFSSNGTLYYYKSIPSNKNLIGVLKNDGNINDKKTVILMGGLDNTKTGLITNSLYYLNTDGSLSTVSGDTSVLIGKALSPTTIKTKKQ